MDEIDSNALMDELERNQRVVDAFYDEAKEYSTQMKTNAEKLEDLSEQLQKLITVDYEADKKKPVRDLTLRHRMLEITGKMTEVVQTMKDLQSKHHKFTGHFNMP